MIHQTTVPVKRVASNHGSGQRLIAYLGTVFPSVAKAWQVSARRARFHAENDAWAYGPAANGIRGPDPAPDCRPGDTRKPFLWPWNQRLGRSGITL